MESCKSWSPGNREDEWCVPKVKVESGLAVWLEADSTCREETD